MRRNKPSSWFVLEVIQNYSGDIQQRSTKRRAEGVLSYATKWLKGDDFGLKWCRRGAFVPLGSVLVGSCHRRTPGWGELELCGIMKITTGNGVHCAVVMCGARLVSEAWTYLHKGSFSQSRGNPIARMSMLGYWLKSDLNFWVKSLWGFMAFNQ